MSVRVKAATARFIPSEEGWRHDQVQLNLSTEEGVEVTFDLDLLSSALLGLTLQPALQAAKTRADAARDI